MYRNTITGEVKEFQEDMDVRFWEPILTISTLKTHFCSRIEEFIPYKILLIKIEKLFNRKLPMLIT